MFRKSELTELKEKDACCPKDKKMEVEELKVLIWRYFLSYWNNRRICSANGGLPPMVKRRQYYEALEVAA